MGNSPDRRANYMFLLGSDKLTELQLYMTVSCQPGSRVIRAFSGVKKPFSFFDLAIKLPNQKMKILFNVKEGSDKQPGKKF